MLADHFTQVERDFRASLEEATDTAADMALSIIKERTAGHGLDVEDRPFAPYRPSTARMKGRTAPVTLVDTGRMLSDLYVQERGRYERAVRFRTREMERRARYHQYGTRRMPRRTFMGLSARDLGRLREVFHDRLIEFIKKDRRTRFRLVFFK